MARLPIGRARDTIGTMIDDRQRLISQMERYCTRCDIAPSTLGTRAGQSGKFYGRLVAGKRAFPETIAAVRRYMKNNPPPRSAKRRNGKAPT
jgi:hypothetical protein